MLDGEGNYQFYVCFAFIKHLNLNIKLKD